MRACIPICLLRTGIDCVSDAGIFPDPRPSSLATSFHAFVVNPGRRSLCCISHELQYAKKQASVASASINPKKPAMFVPPQTSKQQWKAAPLRRLHVLAIQKGDRSMAESCTFKRCRARPVALFSRQQSRLNDVDSHVTYRHAHLSGMSYSADFKNRLAASEAP